MVYTIADLDSHNLKGYRSLEEALAGVLRTIDHSGEERILSLSLADDHGIVAEGRALIALAQQQQQRKTA